MHYIRYETFKEKHITYLQEFIWIKNTKYDKTYFYVKHLGYICEFKISK